MRHHHGFPQPRSADGLLYYVPGGFYLPPVSAPRHGETASADEPRKLLSPSREGGVWARLWKAYTAVFAPGIG